MRKRVSAAAILAALAFVGSALADTPASVYSDFAEDGALNCGHSRSALTGVLHDASLYQYGDPLTFLQLKLAIRRQLAGGCRPGRTAVSSGSAAQSPLDTVRSTPSSARRTRSRPGREQSSPNRKGQAAATTTSGSSQDGGMVLVGVGLLLLTLGSGGWAARRAFADRQ